MSTNDAGELRLRAAPPARSTTRTLRTRDQQVETVERLQPENHIAVEIPKVQDRPRASISQEGAHRAQHFGADRIRQREVNFQKPYGQRFSSSLLITLSRDRNLDKPHLIWKSDSCLNRLTEPQRAETENGSCQVNSRSSAPDTPAESHSYCHLPQTKPFLATKEKDVITVGCNELETTRHLNVNHSLPNGQYGPNQCNGLHLRPCRAQLKRTGTGPIEVEEDIKDHTTLENQRDPELSQPDLTMLSSTVVGVLAPTWSGRIRRNKRFEGTGNSDSMGNLQDVTSTLAKNAHGETQNQHGLVRVMTEGSQTQVRAPFLGTRRNTLDWSTMSDPLRMNYSNNEMIQTVSLDVNSGRTDNRKLVPGGLNPVTTNTPRLSPPSFDPNEQRRNPETGHQGPLSPLSSKPTTSSLLLSLRRINYSGRSSNAPPTFPGENPAPSDQEGNLPQSHLSQTFFNNNKQERSKPVRSPSSISYRSTEIGPVISPSSFSHRERSVSESPFFSTSTLKEDTPFTQQSQTCFKQAFLSNVPSASQETCRGSNKNPNLFPKSTIPSPRHSPYNPYEVLKTHPIPRRTILTSTSWWKQVTKEGSSPLSPDGTTNIKDQPNTPLVPPCNNSSALAGPTSTDSKRFSSQIPNNRDNTNTTESVCKGNMSLIMTEGGTQSLKQIKDLPEHKSDGLFRRQYGSHLNNREPLKPLNLPDVLSRSRFNKATAKTTLSHPKDFSKGPVSNSSFTANLTELPPTFLNLKSSNSPTESSSKYKNDLRSSETSSTPTSLHNKDSEKLTKDSLTLSSTIPLSSQAPTIKTTPGLPPTPNTRTDSSFPFHPLSSQTNVHASNTDTSSQTSKLTEPQTANITPLGFKRSYVFVPTHPKAVSSLIPTVSASPKINNIPVSTASVTSCNIARHPSVTNAPSPSYPTPAIKLSPTTTTTLSSFLTPPTTPIITSPSYLDASNPKEGRKFSSSPERNNKKGKRVRRVTWEDSLDLQCPEPVTVEKPDPSGVPTSPLSPCVRTPNISPFLSSGSPPINTSPLCPTTPKTSSIQMGKGGRYQSLSPDLPDLTSMEHEMSKQGAKDTLISEPARQDLTTTGRERTQSRESCKFQGHSSAALSLPPDFATGYKLRYSSPPYSSLMSSRTTQGEPKTITPRSPLFRQASQSVYSPLSLHAEPGSGIAIPTSKSPLAPVSPTQTFSFPVKNKIATKESSCEVSETYQLNNQRQDINQDPKNGQILLVNNRVHISSPGEKANNSTCVTETLVYNIQFKANTSTAASKNTTPQPLQHTEIKLSQQPNRVQIKKATGEPHTHSGQSSSSGSSADSQSQCEGSRNRKTKENVLGKSRFMSMESTNEQSPKKSRFALKKSVSTPNSSLSRSDSDRSNKTNNKMDQVLNKIKQTFSTRRSDDDPSFPWKWKKASHTPNVSGSSDISTVSDVTGDSTETVKEREKEGLVVIQDSDQGAECTKTQTQNRYSIIPPPAVTPTVWSEKSTPETDQDEQNACAGLSDNKTQAHLTPHSPTIHHLDFYNDSRTYYKPTLQLPTRRDPSPGRSPNPSGSCPTQFRMSTSSSRSPFSPFPSLSPVSPFSSPDISDDNVFYSPKLQRCKESSSPCEQGEGIGLGGSRRSLASTGPPSPVAGQDNEPFASSYADLKYGIEPGRSFSVSSVLPSRPSGPGRISTGSRFLSVGDLTKTSLTCGGNGKDLDQWSFGPDWTTDYDCRPTGDSSGSYFPSDPAKIKSRSLPRSLTRSLGNWSSGDSVSHPGNTTGTRQAHLWSQNMNTFQFGLDAEGPPTPPATPPLSPVSRRMSQPPSPSSPTFPSPPGTPQSVDSQSSKGRLPSRGYVSSLSTFDESSDSSSDTTTDDEYYLETGDGEEKETEL
ncbi:mucin-12 [Pleuronectes platessa]|uniref:mucin-12 n=1 Tax=Pleuronectes platessa TaxID=8262 RepID=UPI00232A48F0|nr:mucin-12 [Pleuronectes platessa]